MIERQQNRLARRADSIVGSGKHRQAPGANGESFEVLSALGSALQGIARSTAGFAVSAHNVANLNTDGFRAQRLDSAGNLRPRHDEPSSERSEFSDVELAEELVDMKTHSAGFRANTAVVRVADRMTGELLDILA